MLANRVKETSTTVGTGTYSLAGAASGFQTFVAGIGTGETCYYVATMGADWEIGIGTVTASTPDTLARTAIIASSNADAAVNWAAGTKDVFCTLPAGASAFKVESSAAIEGAEIIGRMGWARYPNSRTHGFPDGSQSGAAGSQQHVRVGLVRRLSDATPAPLLLATTAGTSAELVLFGNESYAFRALVVACFSATYAKAWEIKGCVRRATSGAAVLVGTPTVTVIGEDAALSAVTIAVSGETGGVLRFMATSSSTYTLTWTAAVELVSSGFAPSL